MMSPIRHAALAWLKDDALPLWHQRGWAVDGHGFVERLTPEGAPDAVARRRVRVQMRQVYVYARAAQQGWYGPARALMEDGLAFLTTRCRPPEGPPGFVVWTDATGKTSADRIFDPYDQAFGFLALAAAYRLTEDAAIKALIKSEIAFADAQLIDRESGLFHEATVYPRSQNPQMHGFEAYLALFEATGDPAMLVRADRIAAHLNTSIVDPNSGALREFFDLDFLPVVFEQWVEPGHHFEWVWLLYRQARLTGNPVNPIAARIMDWGLAHGLNATGFAIDSCFVDGSPRDGGQRLWPQTEFIKANLALEEAGDAAAGARADAALASLMDTYFTASPRGGWIDRLDADGSVLDARMPTSSFYHIFEAISEAARVGGLNA